MHNDIANYANSIFSHKNLTESGDWHEDFAKLASPNKQAEVCGVFGIYAPGEDVAKLTYYGLHALQHRGQESAGIATFDGEQLYLYKDVGLVSQIFNESILKDLRGSVAVGHTRYSTDSNNKANAQLVTAHSHLFPLTVAHDGNLVNSVQLRDKLLKNNCNLVSMSDSEMIALAIAEEINAGADWLEGSIKAFQRCQGAFSLVIGTSAGVMGVRDPNGIRPLIIGNIGNNPVRYVLASETCALDIIGAKYLRDVEPGELVWITEEGLASHCWNEKTQRKLCIFEMIYFARPDSIMHEESLYSYRLRLGKRLAEESPADADIVIGVPDSGIPAAIGFSQVSGIPYTQGLIKNHYIGRSFIQPTQSMRELGIRLKLNSLKDILFGKRVVIVDDSIVVGTTSKKLVKLLRKTGVVEVHMRISSPPVTYPCFYGVDIDGQSQLLAASKSVEEITKQIEVDTLSYLSWQKVLEETRENNANFCSACFTGDYPVSVAESLKPPKLILENLANTGTCTTGTVSKHFSVG